MDGTLGMLSVTFKITVHDLQATQDQSDFMILIIAYKFTPRVPRKWLQTGKRGIMPSNPCDRTFASVLHRVEAPFNPSDLLMTS